MFERGKDCSCLVIWLIALVIGLIVGISIINLAVLPFTTDALWIAFGTGLFGTLFTTILSLIQKARRCICENGKCLALSTIGLLVTAIILLSIVATTITTITAILYGLGVFFFAATILNILKILLCLVEKDCCRE